MDNRMNKTVREDEYARRNMRACPGRNRPEPYGTSQRGCGCEKNSDERNSRRDYGNDSGERSSQRGCGCERTTVERDPRRSCACGNTTERSPLMRRLQELDLALIDTGLYLDAYPTCQEALAYFKRLNCERERVLAEYERQYGPMTIYGAGTKDGEWDWTERPWPWENEAMHEGGRC